MPGQRSCVKPTFRDYSGYVLGPSTSEAAHRLVTIRHSAAVPAWADSDVHQHRDSEEYYFLFQGKLRLWIDGAVYTLQPYEVLMVKPGVPHAVVGGSGPIEHFVLRMPAAEDRQTVRTVADELLVASGEAERELQADWGCRAPLTDARYQNCWLFGVGQALFHSERTCVAYLDFPSEESIGMDSHRHRPHLHQESWEYYTVLRGTRILRVEEDLVAIKAGEVLEVPPQVVHVLHATQVPFEGFTFRVPLLDDKVEF